MVAPIMWLANAIVANTPGGYGEIGLFSAANQWRAVLMFLPSVLLRVALPLMASSLEPTDSADFGKTLLLTQGLTITLALPAGALLMFLSDPIMALYGKEFAGGGTVLIGVASSLMISCIGSGTGTVIEARGKVWRGVLLNLSWGAVVILTVWSLAGVWGAKALAFGYALAYLVLSLWGFWYVASDLPPRMLPRLFWALGYTACLTLLCLWLPPAARVLLAVPAALLTTYATLLAFVDKGVSRSLRTRILAPIRRGIA
jgi:O-antigen/teichoic acid export membrane protein